MSDNIRKTEGVKSAAVVNGLLAVTLICAYHDCEPALIYYRKAWRKELRRAMSLPPYRFGFTEASNDR